MRWLMAALFVMDWLLVSPTLAVTIVLRLALLAGTFTLFFATTTVSELRLALEWMGIPPRYVFSVTLAFQSMGELDEQWRNVVEAQQARGAWSTGNWRRPLERLYDMLALTVPAVVLTAKRAWAVTEAAYARGFESPHRRPYGRLNFGGLDVWLLLGVLVSWLALTSGRW
jgi:energy-coupling factor transport system permease protein